MRSEVAENLKNHKLSKSPMDRYNAQNLAQGRTRAAHCRTSRDHTAGTRLLAPADRWLSSSARFPGLARCRLAFCWPIKGEYDARHLARTLRARGALTALPVVVAPRTPLIFREWHPGIDLTKGPLDIPYPADSQEVTPDAVLLPMNGWDRQGYRLGYGARLLRPHPRQPAQATAGDRRDLRVGEDGYDPSPVLGHPDGLRGHRARASTGAIRRASCSSASRIRASGELASPVCYADEHYFGDKT